MPQPCVQMSDTLFCCWFSCSRKFLNCLLYGMAEISQGNNISYTHSVLTIFCKHLLLFTWLFILFRFLHFEQNIHWTITSTFLPLLEPHRCALGLHFHQKWQVAVLIPPLPDLPRLQFVSEIMLSQHYKYFSRHSLPSRPAGTISFSAFRLSYKRF